MSDTRTGYQLIDNQLPLKIIPTVQIPKNDLGLLKKEVYKILPIEPSNFGYSQNSAQATFRWNYKNAERLRNAKFHLKVKVAGTATKAVLDGKIVALFSKSELRKQDRAVLEHNAHVNKVRMVHKLMTSGKENLKQCLRI